VLDFDRSAALELAAVALRTRSAAADLNCEPASSADRDWPTSTESWSILAPPGTRTNLEVTIRGRRRSIRKLAHGAHRGGVPGRRRGAGEDLAGGSGGRSTSLIGHCIGRKRGRELGLADTMLKGKNELLN
jgi:hypothetical protein